MIPRTQEERLFACAPAGNAFLTRSFSLTTQLQSRLPKAAAPGKLLLLPLIALLGSANGY